MGKCNRNTFNTRDGNVVTEGGGDFILDLCKASGYIRAKDVLTTETW